MNKRERKVYQLEKQLIDEFFNGLRPRPVKVARDCGHYGLAGDDYLEINEFLLEAGKEKDLESTLKHELIHYELRDAGKEYHGHGKAFLKRAKQLGILGIIELQQCLSAEEEEQIPHRTRYVKTPTEVVKKRIYEGLDGLKGLIADLPDKEKIKFYEAFRYVEVWWRVFAQAIERGEDHVMGEVWEKRRGPRGKSLEELKKECDALRALTKPLHEKLRSDTATQKDWKELAKLENKIMKINDKVEADYGFVL